jgi:TRAP-type C4-dicarboxylate transport system substrate-binding protein
VLTPLKSYMGAHYWGEWARLVEQRTKGQMTIILYEPGAVSAASQIYQSVRHGVIDVGCSYGGYHATEVPIAYAEYSLPGAFQDMGEIYKFYYDYKNGAVMELLDSEYQKKGTKLLSIAPFTVGFMTKFEIKTVADLKGKKLRATGAYNSVLKNVGAAPAQIASPEQYMALQLGTIDGTLNPLYMSETYKLKEVIHFIALPPIGYGLGETYVNINSWNKLPENFKKIVQQASIDASYSYWKKYEKLESADIEKAKAAGVKVKILSDATMNALLKACEPVWEEAAAKSPGSRTLIDLFKEFKAEQKKAVQHKK